MSFVRKDDVGRIRAFVELNARGILIRLVDYARATEMQSRGGIEKRLHAYHSMKKASMAPDQSVFRTSTNNWWASICQFYLLPLRCGVFAWSFLAFYDGIAMLLCNHWRAPWRTDTVCITLWSTFLSLNSPDVRPLIRPVRIDCHELSWISGLDTNARF